MKTSTIFLAMGLILSVVVACNNDRGRGLNGMGMAFYTPTAECLLSPSLNGGLCSYAYSNNSGFSNFDPNEQMIGLNTNFQGGFCGCGQWGTPVYHNNWGLGCVATNALQSLSSYNSFNTNVTPLTFQWNAQSLQWVYSNNYYQNSRCTSSAIIACDVRIQGSCGPSGTCQAISSNGYGQSQAGICVLNNNYSNGYGNNTGYYGY